MTVICCVQILPHTLTVFVIEMSPLIINIKQEHAAAAGTTWTKCERIS